MYHLFISIFESQSLFVASYATLVAAIMGSSVFLLLPALSFPVARKRVDGEWEVTTRMKQNNDGLQDAETDVKIKVTFPPISTIAGVWIGAFIWVVVAAPYLTRGISKFLWRRLSFRSPRRFGSSIWEVLMAPVFKEG